MPPIILLKASGYTTGPWLDQSPNGNNATLENGTAALNADGNGLILNGSTSWTFPNVATYGWTASVWYKQIGPISQNECILTQQLIVNGIPLVTLFIGVPPDASPDSTSIYGGFLSSYWNRGGPITLPNDWINIQITWDGSHMKTYIYGELSSSVTFPFASNNHGLPYHIGKNWGGTHFITGEIGEVRIYNIPLTQEQVTADFQESVSTFFNTLYPSLIRTTVTTSSFTASWQGGIGATSYTYTLNGIPMTPSTDSISSKSATFTGLNPSTVYTLEITAVNSTESQSATTTLTTLALPPTAPVVSIGTIAAYSFTVSWTGADRATSYTYTLNDTAVSPSTENISSKTATFSGLTGQTLYSLVVTAVNSGGSESTAVSVITLPPPPSPFTDVIFSEFTPYSFKVSWVAAEGATSYSYTLNGTPAIPLEDTINKNAVFSGLTPNTLYSIVITATNIYGSTSTPTNYPYYTQTESPLLPYGLGVTNITTTSFTISWLGGIGATSYDYSFQQNPDMPTVIDNGISSNSVTFIGLSPETIYLVQVTAIKSSPDGDTSASGFINVWTLATPPTLANILLLKAVNYRSGAWQDESTSANNASIATGNPSKNTRGNGIILDGETSWTFPNVAVGNSWTAGVWYKETESVNGAFILTQQRATSGPVGLPGNEAENTYTPLNLYIGDNGTGIITAGFNDNTWHSSQPVTLNGWTNIQATWDGTNLKTYVNGTLTDSSQPGGTSVDGSLPYFIGGNYNASAYAKGEIGEVRIYNYPLTQEQVTADYNASYNTFATPVPGAPPTALANLTTNTVTGGSFGASWTGGFGATSYTYTLNGSSATPSMDKGLTGQTVVFTGLTASTPYTLVVTAVNANGQPSASISVTTLSPPPPPTVQAVGAVQNTFAVVSTPAAAATAIQAALAANVAPQTLVAAALAVATPAMFTALVSSPAFVGTTVSVPPAAAAALYAAFSPTVTVDTTLPLEVNFPAADGSVRPPAAGSNSKLAIDLTRDTFVPFSGATGYGIDVRNGVQYFVTPTNTTGTLVNVGDQVTFALNSGATITFTVADLDIVFTPYTAPISIICFLGSAPVLTPTGYRRIDRLQIGDIVKTPTGTATIEAIKTQLCEPSTDSNPYVIPEGIFGANRKLLISPRHKVSVSGHMFEARQLGLEQEVQAKPFTYYNIQITKSANMIVAGVEVESLKPLVRVTISRQAFDLMLIKHGGMTREIRSRCHFLADGSVSVPSTI